MFLDKHRIRRTVCSAAIPKENRNASLRSLESDSGGYNPIGPLCPIARACPLQPEQISPLELTVSRVDKTVSGQGPALNLNIRNVSQNCLIGFVINKRFIDVDGRTIMTGSASSVLHSKNGGFKCLAPGEVFH